MVPERYGKTFFSSKYNVHVVGEMYGPADVPIVSTVPIKGVSDLKGVTIRVGAGSIADSLVALGCGHR